MNLVAVFIGGGLGSLVRYGLSKFIASSSYTVFPLATLFSNIFSTAILAWFVYYLQAKMDLSTSWKLFVVTGFCGGFSTFSSFSYETFELMKSGHVTMAVLNVVISVLSCLFLLYILHKNI